MTSDREAVEIKISGRVQGVGFRYFTYQAALHSHVHGWVKNMADGSVLIRVAGAPEKVEEFRQKVRRGPTFGKVDQFEETPLSHADGNQLFDFCISY